MRFFRFRSPSLYAQDNKVLHKWKTMIGATGQSVESVTALQAFCTFWD